MRTIRASEISSYLYCQRAWWYMRSGHAQENLAELAGGQALHERHAQLILQTGCIRTVAIFFLLLGIVLGVVYLTLILL